MDRTLLGWISIPVMLFLLALGIPVPFVLGFIGIIGYWMIAGFDPAMAVSGFALYTHTSAYTFSVLPLFIVMGSLAFHAGFAKDLFDAAQKWLGGFTLGVAHATMVAYAGFAAACGNSIAACASMAKIAIPEFERMGYDRRLGFGVMTAGGTLAPMIPPSMLMVIYGVIAEVSIAKLLIAGILPGLSAAVIFMIFIYIRGRINPNLGPPVKGFTWKERFVSLKGVWGIMGIAAIVMVGIYSGAFTPTEAGALGSFGALVLGLASRRMRGSQLKSGLMEATRTTGMIFLIIATSFMYGYFLAITRLPTNVSELLVGLEVPRFVVLMGVVLFFVVVGCFLDMVAAMFITLPIILPGLFALGYNPIWFGVIMVQLAEIALLTPPFGLNLFVMKGVLPQVDMMEIIYGSLPFLIAAFAALFLFIAFPQIALFLPNLMG